MLLDSLKEKLWKLLKYLLIFTKIIVLLILFLLNKREIEI